MMMNIQQQLLPIISVQYFEILKKCFSTLLHDLHISYESFLTLTGHGVQQTSVQ